MAVSLVAVGALPIGLRSVVMSAGPNYLDTIQIGAPGGPSGKRDQRNQISIARYHVLPGPGNVSPNVDIHKDFVFIAQLVAGCLIHKIGRSNVLSGQSGRRCQTYNDD
jgi:hypothetical protein